MEIALFYLAGACFYSYMMAFCWPPGYEDADGWTYTTFVRLIPGTLFWPIACTILLPIASLKLGTMCRARFLKGPKHDL